MLRRQPCTVQINDAGKATKNTPQFAFWSLTRNTLRMRWLPSLHSWTKWQKISWKTRAEGSPIAAVENLGSTEVEFCSKWTRWRRNCRPSSAFPVNPIPAPLKCTTLSSICPSPESIRISKGWIVSRGCWAVASGPNSSCGTASKTSSAVKWRRCVSSKTFWNPTANKFGARCLHLATMRLCCTPLSPPTCPWSKCCFKWVPIRLFTTKSHETSCIMRPVHLLWPQVNVALFFTCTAL